MVHGSKGRRLVEMGEKRKEGGREGEKNNCFLFGGSGGKRWPGIPPPKAAMSWAVISWNTDLLDAKSFPRGRDFLFLFIYSTCNKFPCFCRLSASYVNP